jgi:hypothetical protein
LQHSVAAFRILFNGLVVFLKEIRRDHMKRGNTKWLPFHYREVSSGSEWDCSTWNPVTGHVEVGLIWHDQCIENTFVVIHKVQGLSAEIRTGELYPVLSVYGLHEFYMDETSDLHADFFEGTSLACIRHLHAALPSMLDSAALLPSVIQCSVVC